MTPESPHSLVIILFIFLLYVSFLLEKQSLRSMTHLRACFRSIGRFQRLSHPFTTPALSANPTSFLFAAHRTSIRRTMASAMAKRLEGKTIVITGASSGIGKSTAKEFARTSPKNLKLILTARRIDTLKEVAAEIKQEVGDGVQVLPVKLDVSNPEEVNNFVSSLPEEFKEIDVLVNNA